MTNQAQDKRPHFVLSNTSEARPFTAHLDMGGIYNDHVCR